MLVDKINTIKTKFDTIQIKQLSQIQINRNNRIYWWKINKTDMIFGISMSFKFNNKIFFYNINEF